MSRETETMEALRDFLLKASILAAKVNDREQQGWDTPDWDDPEGIVRNSDTSDEVIVWIKKTERALDELLWKWDQVLDEEHRYRETARDILAWNKEHPGVSYWED